MTATRIRLVAATLVVLGLAYLAHLYLRDRHASMHTEDNKLTPITVAQWGQEKYLIYLPLYVAMERGYFAAEGLHVSLKYTGNDDQTFATVVSGDALFGIGDPVFAAISNARGFPARVIATIVAQVAIWGVTNHPDLAPLKAPSDLAGLRIGTFPAPSTNYTLMKELVTNMPPGLVPPRIVQAPIGAQLALLESDAADIAMVLEPAASIAESKGYRVVYSSPKFHGPFAFTGVTTTADVLRSRHEDAERFVRALDMAVRLCHLRPEAAVAVAMQVFPNIEPEVVEKAVTRMLNEGTLPESVVVFQDAWRKAVSTRVAVGDITEIESTEGTVDDSLAQKAHAELSTWIP